MKKSKIVLLEDNTDVRQNLKEILELDNYEVIVAENGKVGISIIQAHSPDLILCDIMMPELDGMGVLKIVRNNEELQHTPFIFLTAKAEMKHLRAAMNLGADDYLIKPFTDYQLLESIEVRLKRLKHLQVASNEATNLLDIDDSLWETMHLSKGDTIYRKGTIPQFIYYVIVGSVKLQKTDANGKTLILKMVNTNEFFGEAACILEQHHQHSAIATTQITIKRMSSEQFKSLLYKNRSICKQFIKLMAKHTADCEEHLLEMAYASVRKRIINTLVQLAEHNSVIRLKRDELAALSGTVKETTIRTLKELENDGFIQLNGRSITITKQKSLERLLHQKVT